MTLPVETQSGLAVNSLTFHLTCVPPRTSHHAKRIVRVGK